MKQVISKLIFTLFASVGIVWAAPAQASFYWENASNGNVLQPAVTDGYLYICRVRTRNYGFLVGTLHAQQGRCYISFDGKEWGYSNYQQLLTTEPNGTRLTNRDDFILTESGFPPPDGAFSFVDGPTTVWVCAGFIEGNFRFGRVDMYNGYKCYVPYDGREIEAAEYFVIRDQP